MVHEFVVPARRLFQGDCLNPGVRYQPWQHSKTCSKKIIINYNVRQNQGDIKGNTKGSMVGPRWNLEVKRACLSFPGACKTYANPWEGQNQVGSQSSQLTHGTGKPWSRNFFGQ
jgi:hypothetical protein